MLNKHCYIDNPTLMRKLLQLLEERIGSAQTLEVNYWKYYIKGIKAPPAVGTKRRKYNGTSYIVSSNRFT